MKDKHDYLQQFGVDTDEDIAKTLAMFGGFTEGLQLFASFAMLMNFPRFNKMKGMGQIISWSVRDESLHCEGIIKLFHTFVKERDCLTPAVKEAIIDACQKTVAARGRVHRPRVRDGAGPRHGRQGASRSTSATSPTGGLGNWASRRSTWSTSTRSPGSRRCSTASSTPTSSKPARPNIQRPRPAANWNEVWDNFDRRQKAKAKRGGERSGVGGGAAQRDGPDMFAAAGVAAE